MVKESIYKDRLAMVNSWSFRSVTWLWCHCSEQLKRNGCGLNFSELV